MEFYGSFRFVHSVNIFFNISLFGHFKLFQSLWVFILSFLTNKKKYKLHLECSWFFLYISKRIKEYSCLHIKSVFNQKSAILSGKISDTYSKILLNCWSRRGHSFKKRPLFHCRQWPDKRRDYCISGQFLLFYTETSYLHGK